MNEYMIQINTGEFWEKIEVDIKNPEFAKKVASIEAKLREKLEDFLLFNDERDFVDIIDFGEDSLYFDITNSERMVMVNIVFPFAVELNAIPLLCLFFSEYAGLHFTHNMRRVALSTTYEYCYELGECYGDNESYFDRTLLFTRLACFTFMALQLLPCIALICDGYVPDEFREKYKIVLYEAQKLYEDRKIIDEMFFKSPLN